MNSEECKRQRKELGLSQQILADKIGSYQMAISRYEKEGYVRKGNLIEKLENFFGDSIQEEQYEGDVDIKSHFPTKEESSKFQIRDEVVRPDGVSVGTLIRIEENYLVVSAKGLMPTTQLYHPAYFNAKKSK